MSHTLSLALAAALGFALGWIARDPFPPPTPSRVLTISGNVEPTPNATYAVDPKPVEK